MQLFEEDYDASVEDAELELTFYDAEEASDDDGHGLRFRRTTPRADADHAQLLRALGQPSPEQFNRLVEAARRQEAAPPLPKAPPPGRPLRAFRHGRRTRRIASAPESASGERRSAPSNAACPLGTRHRTMSTCACRAGTMARRTVTLQASRLRSHVVHVCGVVHHRRRCRPRLFRECRSVQGLSSVSRLVKSPTSSSKLR